MKQRSALPVVLLTLAVGLVVSGSGCDDGGSGSDAVCDLNVELQTMDERTLPNDVEDEPYPEPELLEENFVETVRLVGEMEALAPDQVRDDLVSY